MPAPLAFLQIKKDGETLAKHETAEECSGILKKIIKKAQLLKDNHPEWCDKELYLSHDNASFFTAAEMPDGHGEVYHLIEEPSSSPDCHKIVEHPIHPIKAAFRNQFTQLSGKVAHERAMQLLETCADDCVDAQSIKDDISTLNATFRSIIRNGGDWADEGLR